MNGQAHPTLLKRLLALASLLALAACAAPAANLGQTGPGIARDAATAAPAATAPAATATVAPSPTPDEAAAPLLIMAWDETLGRVVRAVDPLTGADAPGHAPLPLAGERDDFYRPTAVARDGRRLAIFDTKGQVCYPFAGGLTCGPRSAAVDLVDVAGWTTRHASLAAEGWVARSAYSADGRRLAVALQGDAPANTLLLLDAANGATLAQTALPFVASLLSFDPAGETLVVYGQALAETDETPPPAPGVLLLDAASLVPLWRATLDDVASGVWCSAKCDAGHGIEKLTSRVPAVVLSADGRQLVIVHADAERLTTVDLRGQAVRTVDIGAAVAGGGPMQWLERLLALTAGVAHAKGPMDSLARSAALSPDGARLYVVGYGQQVDVDDEDNWTSSQESQPLRVIDPADGRLLAESDATGDELHLSPDGQRLLLLKFTGDLIDTSLLDAATLKTIGRAPRPSVVTALDAAGGAHLVAQDVRGTRTNFSVLDPWTLEIAASWSADGPAWALMAP